MLEKPFSAYQGDEPYVFVCYSHSDAKEVYPLLTWLRDNGINLWYDEGISAGDNWRSSIGEALMGAEKVLCFISKRSLSSDHCNREINLALDEGKPLVPVYLEDVTLTPDLKVGLNRLHVLRRTNDSQTYLNALLRAVSIDAPQRTNAVHVKPRPGPGKFLLAALAIVGALSIGISIRWIFTDINVVPTERNPSVVVLPFDSLSIDPEDEYLADGLAEELRTTLRAVASIRVAPTTSSRYFRDHPAPLPQIGESLDVQYAIEGSVRRSGNTVRVSAQLLRVDSAEEIEAVTVDRPFGELLGLQSDLALGILKTLAPEILQTEAREASEVGTRSEQAFALYLKVPKLLDRDTLEAYLRARELLMAAIEVDEHFYRAHLMLMQATIGIGFRSLDFESARERLTEIRQRLDRIDPEGTRATLRTEDASLAMMHRDRATQELIIRGRIIEEPESSLLLWVYGRLLANAGLFSAARDYHQRALLYDPFDPSIHESIGDMNLALGDYSKAIAAYRRCDTLMPGRTGCEDMLVRAVAFSGDVQSAKLLPAWDRVPMKECLVLGETAACSWEEALPEPAPFYAGYIAARRGDMDKAYELFSIAADADNGWSFIDQIRWQQHAMGVVLEGQQYQALLERLNLSDSWRSELCQRARLLTPHTQIEVTCSDFAPGEQRSVNP